MPQNRVARILVYEKGTDGYNVLNARSSFRIAREMHL